MNKRCTWIIFVSLVAQALTVFADPACCQQRAIGNVAQMGTEDLATAQFTKPITPALMNHKGTFKVEEQGFYFLTTDLLFHPQHWQNPIPSVDYAGQITPKSIICIDKDNVVLDLNHKVITQTTVDNITLQEPNLVGIYVKPGVKNVVIKNGSLCGLSGCGILVGENCKNVDISNVSITNCSMGGIIIGHNPFDPAGQPTPFDSLEKVRNVDPAVAVTESTEDIFIKNVYISGSTGYFSYMDPGTGQPQAEYSHAIGILAVGVRNIQIMDTACNGNVYSASNKDSSDNSGGYYVAGRGGYNAYGMHFIRCQHGHIENSECCHNQGWAAFGFLLDQCQSLTFKCCFARHNCADGDPLQHQALLGANLDWEHRDLGRCAGFMLNDSSGNSFCQCCSMYNKGTRETAGFWLRRLHMICSTTPLPDSQLIDPQAIPPELMPDCPEIVTVINLGDPLLVPPVPVAPDQIGTGYNMVATPLYLKNGGSNCNRLICCQAAHNNSAYLGGYGFLSQGNTSNWFVDLKGQSNLSGVGPDAYEPGGLFDFDTGAGAWSLTGAPQYTNSCTGKVIQYAAGLTLESLRLPLSEWNGTTNCLELKDPGNGDLLFLGVKVKEISAGNPPPCPPSGANVFALPEWAESCATVCDSDFRDNYGSCIGAGVGVLLNGGFKNIVKKNWLFCNRSCSTGTTITSQCGDVVSGIGAMGGYGLLDLAANSMSLIMENLAFANQVVRPLMVTDCTGCDPQTSVVGVGPFVEGGNYQVSYSDQNQLLPVASASIGDFGPLNVATAYTNVEWECVGGSLKFPVKDKNLVASVPPVFAVPIP